MSGGRASKGFVTQHGLWSSLKVLLFACSRESLGILRSLPHLSLYSSQMLLDEPVHALHLDLALLVEPVFHSLHCLVFVYDAVPHKSADEHVRLLDVDLDIVCCMANVSGREPLLQTWAQYDNYCNILQYTNILQSQQYEGWLLSNNIGN